MKSWLFALLVASASPAAIPWQWDGAPDLFPRVDVTAGRYVLALEKKRLVLHGPSWSAQVVGRGDMRGGAVLAADGGRVFAAVYNRSASGCHLAAFDGASGKQMWSVGLDGVGPVAHSAYSNRVEMRIIGGHPTVFGSEWRARYVEQRDAGTGALVSHQLLPATVQPDPIGEWLFREIDLMLRKRPAYTVRVNDFLTRHVRMKDADHAARGAAFTGAVRQLAELRRFDITLVDTGDDFEVITKRLPSPAPAARGREDR